MQILNLPYLAQKEILQQMTYGSLFIFSLSSKKSLRLVQSVKFKEINRIEYQWRGYYLKIISRKNYNFQQEIIDIYPKSSVGRGRTKRIRIIGTNETCRLIYIPDPPILEALTLSEHVFGVGHRIPPQWTGLVVDSDEMNDNPGVEAILNHIDILFGSNMTYGFSGYLINQTPMYIPKMTRIVENRIIPNSGIVDAETLDRYFSNLPVQEFVRFSSGRPHGEIPPNSKIFDSKLLDANCYWPNGSDILLNFRGETAILKHTQCNTEDVINFLKRWKSKEAFQNLKSMRVNCAYFPNCFDPEKIKQELEFKDIPATKKLPVRKYYARSEYRFGSRVELQVTFPTYIVRNDGIIGYCLITHNMMYFTVKRVSEQRLLRINSQ